MASFPTGPSFPPQFPKPNAFGAPGLPGLPTPPGGLNRPPVFPPPLGGGFGAPPLNLPPMGLPPGFPAAPLPNLAPPMDSFGPQASALPQAPAFPQTPAAPQTPDALGQQPDSFSQTQAGQPGAAPAQPGATPEGAEGFPDKNTSLPTGGGFTSKLYSPLGMITTATTLGLGIWGGVRLFRGQGIFGYFKKGAEEFATKALHELSDDLQTPLKEKLGKLSPLVTKAVDTRKEEEATSAKDAAKQVFDDFDTKLNEGKIKLEDAAKNTITKLQEAHDKLFDAKIAHLKDSKNAFNKADLLKDIETAKTEYNTNIIDKLKAEGEAATTDAETAVTPETPAPPVTHPTPEPPAPPVTHPTPEPPQPINNNIPWYKGGWFRSTSTPTSEKEVKKN